ncbi:MAG: lipopolysaccharide kinase InaA family protein [Victivallaceae bacterium]
MIRVKSANWVWHFLELEDWNLLGPRPDRFDDGTQQVKINPVRAVFHRDGFYFKLEMPEAGNPLTFWRAVLFPRARSEFHSALALKAAGVPVVDAIAFGQSLTFSMLITREFPGALPVNSYFEREFGRGGGDPEAFLAEWCVFIRRMLDSGFIHPDLHNGNILFAPGRGEFALVDVYGVRRTRFRSRARQVMGRILRDVREYLDDAALVRLATRCGFDAAYAEELLCYGAQYAWREWPKRLKQFRADYAKFVRVEDGLRFRLDRARQPLADAGKLGEFECIEAGPEVLEELYERDFELELNHIPRRRVVAYDRSGGKLYVEPIAAGGFEPYLVRRLEIAGLPPGGFEFGSDSFGRTVCYPKLMPPQ